MTTKTITVANVQRVLAFLDDAQHDIEANEKYLGRYMNGAHCLGFASDEGPAPLTARLAVAFTHLGIVGDAEAVLNLMATACSDTVGLGYIVYFPGLTVASTRSRQQCRAASPSSRPCDRPPLRVPRR